MTTNHMSKNNVNFKLVKCYSSNSQLLNYTSQSQLAPGSRPFETLPAMKNFRRPNRNRNRKRPLITTTALVLFSSLSSTRATLTSTVEARDLDTSDDRISTDFGEGEDLDLGLNIGDGNGNGHDSEEIEYSSIVDLDEDLYDENMIVLVDQKHHHQQQSNDEKYNDHGHWGTPSTSAIENSSSIHTFLHKKKSDKPVVHNSNDSEGNGNGTRDKIKIRNNNNNNNKNPFKTIIKNSTRENSHIITHPPPEAFTLAARIDHKGGKSFFHSDLNIPSIPFMECNSVGTTTPPISSESLSFRSFPKSAHPSSYIYTRGFIVPLTKIEIEVQSVQPTSSDLSGGPVHDAIGDGRVSATRDNRTKRVFNVGEIIWVDGEYHMSSAGEKDVSALIINVPKKEGKSRDIFGLSNEENINMVNCNDISYKRQKSPMDVVKGLVVPSRRVLLASIGVSLSTLMTYFWIKVAQSLYFDPRKKTNTENVNMSAIIAAAEFTCLLSVMKL